EFAVNRLYQDTLEGKLKTARVQVALDGEVIWTFPTRSDWGQWMVRNDGAVTEQPALTGFTLAPSADFTPPVVRGHFFVLRANLNKHYPTAAATAATTTATTPTATPTDDPPPRRRRGPPPNVQRWWSICGEIAARCINPKTLRLEIPKSDAKLAN